MTPNPDIDLFADPDPAPSFSGRACRCSSWGRSAVREHEITESVIERPVWLSLIRPEIHQIDLPFFAGAKLFTVGPGRARSARTGQDEEAW